MDLYVCVCVSLSPSLPVPFCMHAFVSVGDSLLCFVCVRYDSVSSAMCVCVVLIMSSLPGGEEKAGERLS